VNDVEKCGKFADHMQLPQECIVLDQTTIKIPHINSIPAGLIGAAQRVEHYEMAGYGTARSLAHRLGEHQTAEILQQTLNEEGEANKKLTSLAESQVNVAATSKA
jgi:ferritin-like metal-binding protein YciE